MEAGWDMAIGEEKKNEGTSPLGDESERVQVTLLQHSPAGLFLVDFPFLGGGVFHNCDF
jgi:hypothetical protein